MVESSGLLNRRRGINLYRGFESLSLRHFFLRKLLILQGAESTECAEYARCRDIPATQRNGRGAFAPVLACLSGALVPVEAGAVRQPEGPATQTRVPDVAPQGAEPSVAEVVLVKAKHDEAETGS